MSYVIAAVTALTMLVMAGPASAAGNGNPQPNGSNKLQCFDGTSDGGFYGLCSIANGVATLDNVSNDATGTSNPYDQYSGVYITGSNLGGKMLSQVGNISFSYTGTPTNGSPRLSLPLDTNGDGATDVYAFVSAMFCNNGSGFVDVVNNPNCTIFVTGGPVSGYANWSAFAAAYPSAKVGPDGALPFIIADDPGSWTVSNVHLGKAARTTGK